jgi:SAM-dependent methyltransferase
MMEQKQIGKASPFRCVTCKVYLSLDGEPDVVCKNCRHVYKRNRFGYLELLSGSPHDAAPGEDYAHAQKVAGDRVFIRYLKPLFEREPFETVLEVGCGVGTVAKLFAEAGADAYGIDLPVLSSIWAGEGNDPRRFVSGDATNLPFCDNFFDVVYSMGVIEHIGTAIGHCTLASGYEAKRAQFARELVRVTKPGGRIVVSCPNKSFPIDIQHGPRDEAGPTHRLRSFLFDRTGLNIHKTWGKYHLPSYKEIEMLFCKEAGASELECLPLRGYFGFGSFADGFLRPFAFFAKQFVNNIPRPLLPTFFNPYVMVQIRK